MTGRVSPSLPCRQTRIDATGRVVPSLPRRKTGTNVTERFSLPAVSTNTNQCNRRGHPLLVASIHMEPVVRTRTGFGTRVTREYPYPYLPKPISVSTGTGSGGCGCGYSSNYPWVTRDRPYLGLVKLMLTGSKTVSEACS